jgi:hypothetical protein
MSSTKTNKKPLKLKAPKLSNTGTNLSKKVLLNITSLSNYNSDNPLNQHMIKIIQDMYKSRDITNFKTATTALDLLTSKNDFNKFQQTFKKIITQTTNKNNKTIIKQDIETKKIDLKVDDAIQSIAKTILKPNVKFIKMQHKNVLKMIQ